MRFGINQATDDLPNYGELVRRTEAIGVELVGVPDTQAGQYRECYVTLSHALSNTTRVLAGPVVSNAVTRHPAVTAAAIASADELSGGRAFLGMATGDTGLINLGLRPVRMADLEAYILAVRELFDEGRTTWKGRTARLRWLQRPVPIYLAADGPKMLRMAGRVADGVICGMGFRPENVRRVQQFVAEGAREAGRSPDEIAIWYWTRVAVADSRDEALEMVRPSLAASSAHAFRFSLEGKEVPEDYEEPIRELERRYDPGFHNQPGPDNPNARAVAELGLTEYLASRFGVAGTEEQCIGRIRELQGHGVERVLCRPIVHDRYGFLDRWERVIAATRNGSGGG